MKLPPGFTVCELCVSEKAEGVGEGDELVTVIAVVTAVAFVVLVQVIVAWLLEATEEATVADADAPPVATVGLGMTAVLLDVQLLIVPLVGVRVKVPPAAICWLDAVIVNVVVGVGVGAAPPVQ